MSIYSITQNIFIRLSVDHERRKLTFLINNKKNKQLRHKIPTTPLKNSTKHINASRGVFHFINFILTDKFKNLLLYIIDERSKESLF